MMKKQAAYTKVLTCGKKHNIMNDVHITLYVFSSI